MSQAPEAEQEKQDEGPEPAAEKQAEARSVKDRVAGLSEDTLRRIAAELDKNPRLHDARGSFERFEKSLLDRLNIASLDEVARLREQVASLEERLAKAESSAARRESKEK